MDDLTLEKRFGAVEHRVQKLENDHSELKKWAEQAEEFQDKMNSFVDVFYAMQKERDHRDSKRAKIHFALLSGLIALIVGCAVALFTWVLSGNHQITEAPHPIAQVAHGPKL